MRRALGLLCLLVVGATASAQDKRDGYAVLVDAQVLAGDMTCGQRCDGQAVCGEESACLDTAVGRVCGFEGTEDEVMDCGEAAIACRDTQVCVRSTNGIEQLDAFLAHKRNRGLAVHLLSSSDILDGSEENRLQRAQKMRAWLRDNHQALNLKYLLIISHPSGAIPMLMTRPRNNAEQEWATNIDVATDTHYSILQGDWDADGDGVWGEFSEVQDDPSGDYGPQGIHFNYDLAVGRISYYGSTAAVRLVLDKSVRYQQQSADEIAYRNHVLLATEGGNRYFFGEQIRRELLVPNDMTYHRVYDAMCYDEARGDAACDHPLSEAPEDDVCSVANVANAWIADSPGVVGWLTHGSGSGAAAVMSLSALTTIPDANQAMTFQASCNNSSPNNSGNISLQLLRGPVVASVGATSISHGPGVPVDLTAVQYRGSNAGMAYAYFQRLIVDGMTSGTALAELRQASPPPNWWYAANYLTFVLYGDPELALGDNAAQNNVPPPAVDAGPVADVIHVTDAGTAGDAGPVADAGVSKEPADGCSCSGASPGLALLFLGLLARRRRRS